MSHTQVRSHAFDGQEKQEPAHRLEFQALMLQLLPLDSEGKNSIKMRSLISYAIVPMITVLKALEFDLNKLI